MQKYKDTNGNVHCLEDVSFWYLLPAGCVTITDEEADLLSAPVITMVSEITARGSKFKSDMNILQQRWLAAAVANGTSAAAKKLVVEGDIAEAKAQYAADIAEIKARYNT